MFKESHSQIVSLSIQNLSDELFLCPSFIVNFKKKSVQLDIPKGYKKKYLELIIALYFLIFAKQLTKYKLEMCHI